MPLKTTTLITAGQGNGSHAPVKLADAVPRVRIRIGGRKLGPGKADLLDAIGRTASLTAAGAEQGMSPRRARLLVDELNQMFTRPAVAAGDESSDTAELTQFGRELVAAYRRLEARTRAAMLEELASFEPELAPGKPAT